MSEKDRHLQKAANKELVTAKRIARFLAQLPSEKLLQVESTHKQLTAFSIQRQDNDWISKCFVARIAGRDPLRPMLEAKEIDKWLYDFLWNSANFYFSLWDLIQFTRNEIKRYFTKIVKVDFPFNTALELFLEIVRVQEDNQYSIWLKPYHKVSRPDLLEAATLTRKSVWEKTKGGLNSDDAATLDRFLASYPKNFLLTIVWGICLHHSKSNSQIKEKVEAVMRAVVTTAELHATACRKRKSATFNPYQSFEIHKGEILYAKQHGGIYA